MSSHQTHHRARRLRRKMTPAEVFLWGKLRRQQLGVRFRRQHPIGPFVVDFVCVPLKLIIELDGEPHEWQWEHDRRRSDHLEDLGFRIIRFENDVLALHSDIVLQRIRDQITELQQEQHQ